MGTPTKTIHGSRCWLFGQDATKPLGVFESVSTGTAYDHFEPFILGRVSAGEVVLTALQPIMLRLSGFRKVGEGPFSANVGMAKLQDIFDDSKEFTCIVRDRVTPTNQTGNAADGADIISVSSCKIVGQNFNVAARNPARLELEIVGLIFKDEEGAQNEPLGSAEY